MRKLGLCGLAITLVAVGGLGGLALAGEQSPDTYKGLPTVVVIIDGEQLVCDVPAVIVDGRTLVPLRAIMEALGSGVKWDPATKTVSVETEAAAGASTATTGTTTTAETPTPRTPPAPTTPPTPEELAAAKAVYDAAVAAANATYQAAINDICYTYGSVGLHSFCGHWDTYLRACEAAYQQYSGGTGAFDSVVYETIYLPIITAAQAVREAGCAAAHCADPEALYEAAMAEAEATHNAAIAAARAAYIAAGGTP